MTPLPSLLALLTTTTLTALLYKPLSLRAELIGLWRPLHKIQAIHGQNLRFIPNTVQCEDLHHHRESNRLFAACQVEDEVQKRFAWFPPVGNFRDEGAAGRGVIVVVDPETFTSQHLDLSGFSGPFVTHGIDIYSPPTDPTSVYIFAINHLPNPAYYNLLSTSPSSPALKSTPKAHSRIELFYHTIGSPSATHLRSIHHPLIRTPNDVYATSPTSFYVTNDHHYREGFLRFIEDVGSQTVGPWTDTVHISLASTKSTPDASAGVNATVALSKIHNSNGLGHGATDAEILVTDCTGGVLMRTETLPSSTALKIVDRIYFPQPLDNPSFYLDPYPHVNGNASGYIMAGLARAIDLGHSALDPKGLDPVMVWHVKPAAAGASEPWEKKLVFQDNGTVIRTASIGVVVGIDPEKNRGRKQGWLFVTGFFSKGMVATKIDL